MVKQFNNVVNRPGIDPDVARALRTLCKLYAVYGIHQRLGDFMQVIYVTLSTLFYIFSSPVLMKRLSYCDL